MVFTVGCHNVSVVLVCSNVEHLASPRPFMHLHYAIPSIFFHINKVSKAIKVSLILLMSMYILLKLSNKGTAKVNMFAYFRVKQLFIGRPFLVTNRRHYIYTTSVNNARQSVKKNCCQLFFPKLKKQSFEIIPVHAT